MKSNLFFGLNGGLITGPPPVIPQDLNFNVFSNDLRSTYVAQYFDGHNNAGPYWTWDTVSGGNANGVQTGTKLQAGQSGYISMGYQNLTGDLQGHDAVLGFKTDTTLTDYHGFLVCFFYGGGALGSNDINGAFMGHGLASPSRIFRDGLSGTLTLQVNNNFGDPSSWSDIRVFSLTSTADLYVGISIYAANSGIMYNPKTYNFT